MASLILFYAGFLLILILFTEEFGRAVHWLRATLKQYPRYKALAYPLIFLLTVAAGLIITSTLIRFAALTFSYD